MQLWLKRFMKKFYDINPNAKPKEEDKDMHLNVKYPANKKPKSKDNLGEYIDYEDINEK